jgi:hypothetical protein
MPDVSPGLALVLLLILGAEFVNGWTDAPNAIATVVSTRSLTPLQAVIMAAVLNLAGVFSGTAVAQTIGQGIIDTNAVNLTTVGGAMVGIVLWSSVAARWGIPTSESHALVAGLAGAGIATAGPGVLVWAGWKKVLLGLVFSTFLGFFGGLMVIIAIYWMFQKAVPGDLPRPSDPLLRFHGLQSRLERRSEVHGHVHVGSGAGQRPALVRDPYLGDFPLRGSNGARNAHGGLEDHSHARHEDQQARDASGVRRGAGGGEHHHARLSLGDPTFHDAHDLYGDRRGRGCARSLRGSMGSNGESRRRVGVDLPDLRGNRVGGRQARSALLTTHPPADG